MGDIMTKLNYNWTSATTTTSTFNEPKPDRPFRFFTPKTWDSNSSGSTYTHLASEPLIDVYNLTPEITNTRYLENNCINTKKGEFLDYQFKNEFSINNTQNRALDMKEMRKFFNKL